MNTINLKSLIELEKSELEEERENLINYCIRNQAVFDEYSRDLMYRL